MFTPNPFIEIASGYPLLSLVTFLPLFGAALVALVPNDNRKALQVTGLFSSMLTLLGATLIWRGFDAVAGFQMVDRAEWLPGGICYCLGVDGLNLLLVMLTAFITPLVLLSAMSSIQKRVKEFVLSVLLLETAMLGCVMALDIFLFYFFCEALLIPMYLLIGMWGGKERVYATTKFVMYTMFGSALMLVALVYLYLKTGATSSAYVDILALELSEKEQTWLFAACAFAFAIKVPMVPFHTWLGDAHSQAPTAGSVFLTAFLLNVGAYAFLRFSFPLFPYAAGIFSKPFMALAVVGIIYGAFLAYAQTDLKKLVAYASISHLGFILLGIFAFTEAGVEGALLHMFNHGITAVGLLFCIGILVERRQTSSIAEFGGIAKQTPKLAALFMVLMLSSIGAPGTNGFAGEFLIISGTFQEALHSQLLPVTSWNPNLGLNENLNNVSEWLLSWRVAVTTFAILAVVGAILVAVYMLSMFRRVMFGPLDNSENEALPDLSVREQVYLAPLVALVFIIGFSPNLFMEKTHASVDAYISHVRPGVSAVRAPITEQIKRSRRGVAAIDAEVPLDAQFFGGTKPAGPAPLTLPQRRDK
jgi:NADH-quinone oxidoreductase subunit M